jgi:hypothetical protein
MPEESSALLRHYFNLITAPETTYVTHSGATIPTNVGLVQGDNTSPLLFSATLNPVLKGVSKTLGEEGKVFGFLDDVLILGDPVKVSLAFKHFSDEAAKLGLQVNAGKTKWIGEPVRFQEVHTRILEAEKKLPPVKGPDDVEKAVVLPKPNGLRAAVKYLGAPLGISAEAENSLLHDLIKEVPAELLHTYPDLQGRMLMLRIGMNEKYSYIMKTNRCKGDVRAKMDKALHEQVLGIVDIEFERSEWGKQIHDESTLPMQMGGLGLTHIDSAAPIAYATSVIKAYQRAPSLVSPDLWDKLSEALLAGKHRSGSLFNSALTEVNKLLEEAKVEIMKRDDISAILSNKQQEQPTNSPLVAAPVFPTSIVEALKWDVPEKTQGRLQAWCAKARERQWYEGQGGKGRGKRERARHMACCQPGSSEWLIAKPVNKKVTFKNLEYRVAVRQRMGLPVLEYLGIRPNTPCPCNYTKKPMADGKPRDLIILDDAHALNCHLFCGALERHDELIGMFVEAFTEAGISTKREVRVTGDPDSHQRYDITGKMNGVTTHFDGVVSNPEADQHVTKAAVQGLATAEKAAEGKNDEYIKKTAKGELFFPLSIEAYGGMHKYVFALLGRLAVPLLNRAADEVRGTASTFVGYWTQVFSVTVVRATARMALVLAERALSQMGHGRPEACWSL